MITAVGLLVMMYPILCKVRFEALVEVFSHKGIWKQIGFSVFMNWIVAPFLMVRIKPPLENTRPLKQRGPSFISDIKQLTCMGQN